MVHIFVKKLWRKFQNCVKEGGISQKNDKFGVKYRIARIKKNNIKYFLGMKAEKNKEITVRERLNYEKEKKENVILDSEDSLQQRERIPNIE